MNDVNDQDKLMAALCYITGIVAIIVLLVEDMKNRPFQKYHAVQSLVLWAVITLLGIVLGWTVVLACVPCLLWFVAFYWAYQAYQGEWIEIPVITSFIKGQGWV